jgi:hypothetical protein
MFLEYNLRPVYFGPTSLFSFFKLLKESLGKKEIPLTRKSNILANLVQLL